MTQEEFDQYYNTVARDVQRTRAAEDARAQHELQQYANRCAQLARPKLTARLGVLLCRVGKLLQSYKHS